LFFLFLHRTRRPDSSSALWPYSWGHEIWSTVCSYPRPLLKLFEVLHMVIRVNNDLLVIRVVGLIWSCKIYVLKYMTSRNANYAKKSWIYSWVSPEFMDFRWTLLGVYPFFIFTFLATWYLPISLVIAARKYQFRVWKKIIPQFVSLRLSWSILMVAISIYKIFSSWAVLIKSFFYTWVEKILATSLPTRSIKRIGIYHISVTINKLDRHLCASKKYP